MAGAVEAVIEAARSDIARLRGRGLEEVVDEEPREDRIVMEVLCAAGDSKLEWDPTVEAEVEAARDYFGKFKGKGYSIFRSDAGGARGARMETFDPAARRLTVVPPVRGGAA